MEYKMREDGTAGVPSFSLRFKLFFSITRGTIALRRKFIPFLALKKCAFLPLVKTQALFQHTSLG